MGLPAQRGARKLQQSHQGNAKEQTVETIKVMALVTFRIPQARQRQLERPVHF